MQFILKHLDQTAFSAPWLLSCARSTDTKKWTLSFCWKITPWNTSGGATLNTHWRTVNYVMTGFWRPLCEIAIMLISPIIWDLFDCVIMVCNPLQGVPKFSYLNKCSILSGGSLPVALLTMAFGTFEDTSVAPFFTIIGKEQNFVQIFHLLNLLHPYGFVVDICNQSKNVH